MSLENKRRKVLAQLDALKIFDNTLLVRQLTKELTKKLREIERQTKIRTKRRQLAEQEEQDKTQVAIRKSNALKKYHHYIRLIHDNYPEVPYAEIRALYKARKEGQVVSIPDVVWQNPSP